MPLVDCRDAPELRRLMCEQFIDNYAIKTERCQGRDPGSAQIVYTPSGHGLGLPPEFGGRLRPRVPDCRIEVALALRETRDRPRE